MYLFKNFDKISSITNEQKLNRMIEWYLFIADVTNDIACQALYMVFFRHHAEKSHLCDMPELY